MNEETKSLKETINNLEKELLIEKTKNKEIENKLKKYEEETQTIKHRLQLAEQALLFNAMQQLETTNQIQSFSSSNLSSEQNNNNNNSNNITNINLLAEKEKEIKSLQNEIQSKEIHLRDQYNSQLQPLQRKLQLAEQALVFNADMNLNLLQTITQDKEQELTDLKGKLAKTEQHVNSLMIDELLPLRNKLRIAEQALLFQTDQYLNQLSNVSNVSNTTASITTTTTIPTSSSSSAPLLTLPKLENEEEKEKDNNNNNSNNNNNNSNVDPHEINELKKQITEAEQQARLVVEQQLRPLREKLQSAEKLHQLNATLYARQLETSYKTSQNEVLELKQQINKATEKFKQEKLESNPNLDSSNTNINTSNPNTNPEQMRSSLLNAQQELQAKNEEILLLLEQRSSQETITHQQGNEINELKQKLKIAEQALELNANLYFKYSETLLAKRETEIKELRNKLEVVMSGTYSSEVAMFKQKLQVAEQALLFYSEQQQRASPHEIALENEVETLRNKLNQAEQTVQDMNDKKVLPLLQKLQVAEQALIFNTDMFSQQLASRTTNEDIIIAKENEITTLKCKLAQLEKPQI
eukprot:TRINITY_DN48_c1_g1_i1.p1 TRINITY_DN48_c1_g1~~TRINITY_DN48_c1_g1_i1.p1  ORF type:complete len:583 (+),score=334.22 TRINITY_DN48_c1_g1_i1:64-1812(+)